MRAISIAAMLCLAAGPAAGADERWRESEQVFLPNAAPRGEHVFQQGGSVLRLPLLWDKSVRLETAAELEFSGQRGTIRAGTILPRVLFRDSGVSNKARELFCTRSSAADRNQTTGWVGLFADKAFKGMTFVQTCLEDADRDGRFERALLIHETKYQVREGKLIAPIAYARREREPISEASDVVELQLREVSAVRVVVRLNVVRRGRNVKFKTFSSGMEFGDSGTIIPVDQDIGRRRKILGIQFEIAAVDPVAKTATIRFPADAPLQQVVAVPLDIRSDYY